MTYESLIPRIMRSLTEDGTASITVEAYSRYENKLKKLTKESGIDFRIMKRYMHKNKPYFLLEGVTLENKEYSINQIMTIVEAADRYGINQDTLKNKFKRSMKGNDDKINKWIEEGLIRQSGKTWLITEKFMEINFKNNN